MPWLLAAATCARAGTPVLYTIDVDGNMADWNAALADADNFSTDPQGVTPPSSDRDYPVSSSTRDLLRYAYTWDNTNFYLYFERNAATTTGNAFLVYVDRDNDGRMESTDRVVVNYWWGGGFSWSIVYAYAPAAGTGDPIVNALGFADGYNLPGALGSALSGQFSVGGAADGRRLEASVSWARLGLAAGSAFQYHVAAASGGTLPANLDDNMGGAGGQGGSTGYAQVAVTPNRSLSAGNGASLVLAHSVANTGNQSATVEMTVKWSCSGTLVSQLYFDANGDGLYQPATDPPLTDSNGNGRVDRVVGAGGAFALLAVVTLPTGLAPGSICTVQIGGEPPGVPESAGSADNTITITGPLLTLVKAADRATAAPGDVITYTTAYSNGGGDTALAVVLFDAVPTWTTYVAGSAAGAGTTPEYSHDNGSNYDASEAPPVTHVRWTRAASLPAGGSGVVTFKARVD